MFFLFSSCGCEQLQISHLYACLFTLSVLDEKYGALKGAGINDAGPYCWFILLEPVCLCPLLNMFCQKWLMLSVFLNSPASTAFTLGKMNPYEFNGLQPPTT